MINGNQNKHKPSKAFWITNVIGWLLLFVFNSAVRTYFRQFSTTDVLTSFIVFFLGFIVTIGIRYAFHRFNLLNKKLYQIIPAIILISVLATTIVVNVGIVILYTLQQFLADLNFYNTFNLRSYISNFLNFELIVLL